MNRKALVLLSGGLDSILAARVMLEQSVEVQAVSFSAKLCMCGVKKTGASAAQEAAQMLGIPLETIDFTGEFMEIVRNPRHGHGANMNPCIDCKIAMFSRAKAMMGKFGASFLVTGEVLGERPMSQRRDALNIIDKAAGTKGILLRPLSAKLLDPTVPEKEGLVDREKLYDIRGRSRKPQIEMAARFGITKYPQPAGGCLLTDPGFAKRVKEAMGEDEFTPENLSLLSVGRQFRLAKGVRLVVGRDQDENALIESLAKPEDMLLKMARTQGPISLLRGFGIASQVQKAGAIAAYHTKLKNDPSASVSYWYKGDSARKIIDVRPASAEEVDKLRV